MGACGCEEGTVGGATGGGGEGGTSGDGGGGEASKDGGSRRGTAGNGGAAGERAGGCEGAPRTRHDPAEAPLVSSVSMHTRTMRPVGTTLLGSPAQPSSSHEASSA